MGFGSEFKRFGNRVKRETKRLGNQVGDVGGLFGDLFGGSGGGSGSVTGGGGGGGATGGPGIVDTGAGGAGDTGSGGPTGESLLDAFGVRDRVLDFGGGGGFNDQIDSLEQLPNRDEVISKVLFDQLSAISKKRRNNLGGNIRASDTAPTASTTLFGV